MMIRSGWVLSAVLLFPNLLWVAWPGPAASPEPMASLPHWVVVIRPVETALRVAVFTLPLFLTIDLAQPRPRAAAAVAVLALALYYAAWVRYFVGGRDPSLLFRSWGGLPVPLAITPVVYLLASALLTRSALMAGVASVFGVVHVLVSRELARSA